jgi:hypothetical protein
LQTVGSVDIRAGTAPRWRQLAFVCAACIAALALVLHPGPAAGADDPGGHETANLIGPPEGKLYGFAGVSQVGDPDPTTAAGLISALNGNASRTAIHWQGIEPTRDSYRTASLDRYRQVYDAMRLRGITPIFVVQFAPVWARDPGAPQACGTSDTCHYPPSVEMLGEWREFIAELARRFPEAVLEIWNEPNYPGQWQSGVDPERYAQLLEAAYETAKSINPGTMVISGGLATAPKSGWIGAGEFLRRAYAATPSLKGHTDAVNFHAYPGGDGLGAGSSFAAAFADVRAARAAAGDEATPLIVTETGASTSGPNALTADQQAQLLQAVTRKILTMDDTLGALVYSLSDRTQFPQSDPERGFGVVVASPGLLGSEIVRKLSYCTLERAVLLPSQDCPPETELDATPPPLSRNRDVTLRFSSSDGGVIRFECSLDGRPYSGCSSPYEVDALPVGSHAFSVRAKDALNKVDPYPARVAFGIAAPPPPPPPPPPTLAAVVKPRKTQLPAGGKRKRFRVTVGAPGTARPVAGVSVCMTSEAGMVRGELPLCKALGTLAPGGRLSGAFKVGLKPSAAGRKLKLSFTAAATGAVSAVATSRVRGRRSR